VGKLGFRIDEHAVRRAGLDYWHLVDLRLHETLEAAERSIATESRQPEPPRTWLLSGRSKRSFLDVSYRLGDVFVFGKESVGLPDELLQRRSDETLGIPMLGEVRSHNLANAVAIVVYEALRQTGCLRVD
jgi:tRNA (cytidine/uridine-2'-O-)-methyltransferase